MVKERGLPFQPDMALAAFEDRKTNTRRPIMHFDGSTYALDPARVGEWKFRDGKWWAYPAGQGGSALPIYDTKCPYGVPGDRLWVREAWRVHANYNTFDAATIWIASNGDMRHCVYYEATGKIPEWAGRYRYGRFMPRWASRTLLEVTDIRIERLQAISQQDAINEGGPPSHFSIDAISREYGYADFPRSWFAQLWDSINAERAPWRKNPWVWVVVFKRVTHE